MSQLPVGTSIGAWEVEEKLGSGATGTVYRCRNPAASRITAAIKLLDPRLHAREDSRARFLREAEILFSLDHPHVVSVSNINLKDPAPYLEMEFVDGIRLDETTKEGRVPLGVTLERAKALASAVSYLHARGVFHRDIKPENILIRRDGHLKLVDFGVAIERGAQRITAQGKAQFGTVSYCPPEWMGKENIDPGAWDRYALGVVLFEMFTGKTAFPFSADRSEQLQILQIVAKKAATPCLDPGPGFQSSLRRLIRTLTARDPADRPQMEEVTRVLGQLDPSWQGVTIPNVPRTMATPADPIRERAAPAGAPRGWTWILLLVAASSFGVALAVVVPILLLGLYMMQ